MTPSETTVPMSHGDLTSARARVLPLAASTQRPKPLIRIPYAAVEGPQPSPGTAVPANRFARRHVEPARMPRHLASYTKPRYVRPPPPSLKPFRKAPVAGERAASPSFHEVPQDQRIVRSDEPALRQDRTGEGVWC